MKIITGKNEKAPITNLLEKGDTFRTDSSITIRDLEDDESTVVIAQCVYANNDDHDVRSIDFDRPLYAEKTYPRSNGRSVTLEEVIRVKDISIADKFFVVADVEKMSDSNLQRCLAVESCYRGAPIPSTGVVLAFYQACDGEHDVGSVSLPYYVAHNPDIDQHLKTMKIKIK